MKFRVLSLLIAFIASYAASAQNLSPDRYPLYHLQRNDVLEVKYRYTPEFDQTVTIGPDGHVYLVGLGDLVALDLTVDQLREQVIQLSSKRLVNPVITVSLKEFEKPHVYVEGEVNTPGRVEFRSPITVNDAIALAGGFKTSAKQSEVLLLHRIDKRTETTRVINVKKIVASHHLEEAAVLEPGDVIYVPQNGMSKAERLIHLGQFGAIYNPVP